jgi:hypothetical protein
LEEDDLFIADSTYDLLPRSSKFGLDHVIEIELWSNSNRLKQVILGSNLFDMFLNRPFDIKMICLDELYLILESLNRLIFAQVDHKDLSITVY